MGRRTYHTKKEKKRKKEWPGKVAKEVVLLDKVTEEMKVWSNSANTLTVTTTNAAASADVTARPMTSAQ